MIFYMIDKVSVKITDRKGLFNYICRINDYKYDSLAIALKTYMYNYQIKIDDSGYLHIPSGPAIYISACWETIAPYLEGYIEWYGENKAWRDRFENKKYYKDYSQTLWESGEQTWMTIDECRTLYQWLQGEGDPQFSNFVFTKQPKLSEEAAFSVIYYLQERFSLIPSMYERCSVCGCLYDSEAEGTGIALDDSCKNYCDKCRPDRKAQYER